MVFVLIASHFPQNTKLLGFDWNKYDFWKKNFIKFKILIMIDLTKSINEQNDQKYVYNALNIFKQTASHFLVQSE
jgi:hypothetical protein